jgi:DNA polymerase elongation subunit (family B)
MSTTIPMFTGIHHDTHKDMVFVWHGKNNKPVVKKVKHQFFTPNRGEMGAVPSGKKDIYGKDMYIVPGVDHRSELDIRSRYAGPHNYLSEIDIDYRTRFLESYYNDVDELRFDMDDFNVCFLDIEVESGKRFPTAKRAAERVNCVTIYLSSEKKYYVYGLEKDIKPETYEKLRAVNAEYIKCPTEKHLLTWLFTKIGEASVDVITGWNCVSKDTRVWLDDKIEYIPNIKKDDILTKCGDVKIDSVLTGKKKVQRLKLSNGSYIESSSDHKFPVSIKSESEYCDYNRLNSRFEESGMTVTDINNKISNGDQVYVKYVLGKRRTNNITYKKLILDNIDYYLSFSDFDIIIDDDILFSRMEENGREFPIRWSEKSKRISDAPSKFSYKLHSDIYSKSDLVEYIKNRDILLFKANKKTYEIDVSDEISNDLLYLLGMWYTDGTYSTDEIRGRIYNSNESVLETCSNIISESVNSSGNIYKSNDGCSSISFTKNTNHLYLLYPAIYDNENNKSINTPLLSQLSTHQFIQLFSGMIDGDGSVTKDGSITFCNYNNNDRYLVQELLSWNGYISTVRDNTLRINRLSINEHIYSSLNLKHHIKQSRLVNAKLIDIIDSKNKKKKWAFSDDLSEVFMRIESVTELEKEDMMYETTTSSSLFVGNGILTHNCDWYDNPFLMKRAALLEVDPKLMSRLPFGHKKCYEDKRTGKLVIGGTECLDYLKLFKQFSRNELDDYKLDTIGKAIVGEEKAPLPDGYQSYNNYWDDYVWYNIKDVELVVKIDEDQRLIETAIGACSEARVPFGHIFESKKILVGFLLNFLHKRGFVMPPLKENESKKFPGAYVYSTPGYYEELVSYDYRSMYPSIMMGANISPETKVTFPIDHVFTPEEEEYVKTLVKSPWDDWGTKKIYYRKDIEGIVPQVVKILFDGRTELKKEMKRLMKLGKNKEAEYYDMKQQAYKIFGNSLYGLLGNSYFQLYDLDNSASVTAYGVDLITSTIEDLVHYFENDFENDERYYNVFGEKPTLDKSLFGNYVNDKGQTIFNRISHGDTDSFFVKYSDIYPPFGQYEGKDVEIYVFKGNQLVSKQRFDLETKEHDSKVHFNRMCSEYISDWDSTSNERKKKMFVEGIVFGDDDYRVIYSKFTLTDYSRIIDAALMEDKLDEIMQVFQGKWNYLHDTIFLKREKCIKKAIVQAKKKYICKTESNEDMRYYKKGTLEPILKYAVTGLEIVRSSTTPFARERIQFLIDIMLDEMDKKKSREELLKIKEDFFEITKSDNPYDICIPSGVGTDPPDYNYWSSLSEEQKKANKLDWRVKSGMVWNYLIETDPILSEMTLEPIAESSKAKFINVVRDNPYGVSKIAFVGKEPPQRLLELFYIDWEDQWQKTYGDTMGRLFEAVGWSSNLESDERDMMMDIF